jgi:hypothetical protein
MPLIWHPVFFPDQRQRPGKQDGDQEQRADHGQRKPDVVLAIEKDPGRQREPGDKADRRSVDIWMEVI